MPKEYADRIKLPLQFNAQAMLENVVRMELHPFVYYDVMPLRSPAHMVDPSLPVPPPVEDYADGSWTEWRNIELLEKSPVLKQVVDTFAAHCFVTLVRLLRLEAGSVVKEHTDPTLGMHIDKSVVRLTISY